MEEIKGFKVVEGTKQAEFFVVATFAAHTCTSVIS
jgi:hypothetical protein